MKLQIVLILVVSAYIVDSQLINLTQSFSGILESVNNLNNFQVLNNNNLPSLASLLDFLQLYSNIQNAAQSAVSEENECTRQLKLFFDGLMEMEEWALRMIDATAKLQSGLLEGAITQVGNYDECLKIDVSVNGTQINGQYCTAAISDKETVVIESKSDLMQLLMSYGFCVPAACNATYLSKLVRPISDALQYSSRLFFLDDFCESSIKTKPLTTGAIVTITIFVIAGIVIVLSTLYDIIISYMADKKALELLIVFSLYTNGQKLFATKKSADAMGCLNGMRVISMFWIIAGHQYLYTFKAPAVNLVEILQWTDSTRSVIVTAGNMAVDTFFVVSGLLVVYVFMKAKENGQNMSVIMMYIHRLTRLTPPLAMLILFVSTCLTYTGSGPSWHGIVLYYVKPCEHNWWSTLLYIQNYVHPNDVCIDQTWYLAVDTQLYFLSPLLLFPLMKYPKRTIVITLIIAILCCIAAFEITWLRHLKPAHYALADDVMRYLYAVTHVRASSWLIGFITGYVIFNYRNRVVVKISKVKVMLMWTISMSLMIGIILYHDRLGMNSQTDRLEASLFNALARSLWALGLSVIIFLCVTGYGGFVNRFLSSSVFTILIRVNYNMYLLHVVVMIYLVGQSRIPEYGSMLKTFYVFWGDTIITLLLSIIWTLSFESPILALEKILLGKKNRPSPAPKIFNNVSMVIVDDKVTNSEKNAVNLS